MSDGTTTAYSDLSDLFDPSLVCSEGVLSAFEESAAVVILLPLVPTKDDWVAHFS